MGPSVVKAQCSRCGELNPVGYTKCGLCRRPRDAAPGWEMPEHDHPDYAAARARLLPTLGLSQARHSSQPTAQEMRWPGG